MTFGLAFAKMSGAGNDFVLVEASRLPPRADLTRLARTLCDRRRAVGADGLLVLRRGARGAPAFVDHYNADGTRAFCANGSRCAAWYIHSRGWGRRRFAFETIEGPLDAAVTGTNRARVRMPRATGLRLGLRLTAAGRPWTVHAVDTGVPHAVVEVPVRDLESFPVLEVGRALRRHADFQPAGANVDFVSRAAGVIALRTFERGVEDETLACGTGVAAAAVCMSLLHGMRSPIRLRTRGGHSLTVRFKAEAGRFDEVWLEGPAELVFEGRIGGRPWL